MIKGLKGINVEQIKMLAVWEYKQKGVKKWSLAQPAQQGLIIL